MSSCAVLKIPDVYGELTFSHPEGLWTGDGKGTGRPATLGNSKVLYGNFSGSTSTMTNSVPARKVHLSLVPNKTENPDSAKVLPLFSKGLYRTFSGKELDTETGLYYFGARYYDPRISLWESADPILDEYLNGERNDGVYNSFNLNSYGYCEQNPIRLTDPDGKVVIDIPFTSSYLHVGLTDVSVTSSKDLEKKNSRLKGLSPAVRHSVERVLVQLKGEGYQPRVGAGKRTQAEEDQKVKEGHSHTRNSYHLDQGGRGAGAADVIDKRWGWNDKSKDAQKFFKELGGAAKSEGLNWGGDWTPIDKKTGYGWDPAHVQTKDKWQPAKTQ